jgi:hypothetical protein
VPSQKNNKFVKCVVAIFVTVTIIRWFAAYLEIGRQGLWQPLLTQRSVFDYGYSEHRLEIDWFAVDSYKLMIAQMLRGDAVSVLWVAGAFVVHFGWRISRVLSTRPDVVRRLVHR